MSFFAALLLSSFALLFIVGVYMLFRDDQRKRPEGFFLVVVIGKGFLVL